MKYSDSINSVPPDIRQDALWNQEVYRLALFASHLGWSDSTKLFYQKDRARFYGYALGSARESRTWYFDARPVLGDAVVQHRIRLHTNIIRLLLKMIPPTRGYALHESDSVELLAKDYDLAPSSPTQLKELLECVPLPDDYETRNTEHGTQHSQ